MNSLIFASARRCVSIRIGCWAWTRHMRSGLPTETEKTLNIDRRWIVKISEMKPSKYVKKEDVEDGVIVTIYAVTEENVAMENQPPEMKHVMSFKEDIRPLVLNWTNIQLCAQAVGSDDTDDWPGKQIILYNDPSVSFGGKVTGGVRIRKAVQSTPRPAPAKASGQDYSETNPPPIGEDLNDPIPF